MASRTKKTSLIILAIAAAAAAIVAAVLFAQMRWATAERPLGADAGADVLDAPDSAATTKTVSHAVDVAQEDSDDSEPPEAKANEEPPKTDEELREEAEERAVDSFDALTDKWMNKDGGEVSMKDVDEFVKSFKAVPGNRKEECLQRALNLVSDDHVLLLAGILFDKTVEKEYLELVFNDVLNRDESVKNLILPMIYKDKGHPCWADTAWILDVTGETPKKENNQ